MQYQFKVKKQLKQRKRPETILLRNKFFGLPRIISIYPHEMRIIETRFAFKSWREKKRNKLENETKAFFLCDYHCSKVNIEHGVTQKQGIVKRKSKHKRK